MLTRNGPSGSLRMRDSRVASGRSWRITKTQAIAVGTWRLREICRRPQPWRKASAWRTWFPKTPNTTGGAWNKIEQDTRHYVKRAKGDVFVITGPVFTDAGPRIGANGVKVPTYLYKLVYDATTNKAWAHWQENREGETVGRPISYQELVKRTGVEFLPRSALPH